MQRQRKRAGYIKSGNSRASLAALEKKGEASRERLEQCVREANLLLPAFPEKVVAVAAVGPGVEGESGVSQARGEQQQQQMNSNLNADAGIVNENAGAEKGIADCVVRGAALVDYLQHVRNRRPLHLSRRRDRDGHGHGDGVGDGDGDGDGDNKSNASHRRPRRESLQKQSKEGQFVSMAGLPVPAPLPMPLSLAQSAVEETWERVVSEGMLE